MWCLLQRELFAAKYLYNAEGLHSIFRELGNVFPLISSTMPLWASSFLVLLDSGLIRMGGAGGYWWRLGAKSIFLIFRNFNSFYL